MQNSDALIGRVIEATEGSYRNRFFIGDKGKGNK
jgi:hypothetical protein